MDVESAIKLLEDLPAQPEQVKQLSSDVRQRILALVKNLPLLVLTPEQIAFMQIFETPPRQFAIRMAVDLRIFHILVERAGTPISSADLASQCGAEEVLVVRIMRVVTAAGYAQESGAREYVATRMSKAMVVPHIEAFAAHVYEASARSCNRMPEYFKTHGYKNPEDDLNGPSQYALGTDLHFFEYLHKDPVKAERFNICMTGSKAGLRFWFEWFPVTEHLVKPFKASGATDVPFLVDLGGGIGLHVRRLLEANPEAEPLVLQDLPGTIAKAKDLDPRIKPMVHDFFTQQPIKGAYLYYTRLVLHDWPDERCRTLLKATATAMKPGFSRVLLNETIIPEKDCPPLLAAADITMMSLLAGMERTKKQWIDLVESSGLRVVKIWHSPDFRDLEGVIECEVPE
ncbi:S-adenosyl-L-methionine-dependent methyltransferase [Cercophora newfieldiana]|uniref:S-adenosyl-L-methionine-dependent methyltransferase n=1 Tax=Cercophora newfieldiana TaxID=92897 RepID=A0AA39XTF5_9PEZI|nr:S-adenosyl-L-methionine-dependent methyltransferase [Cercophora newfieldiana]